MMKYINVPTFLIEERVLRSPEIMSVWLYLHLTSCGYNQKTVISRGSKDVPCGKKKNFLRGTLPIERTKICTKLNMTDGAVRNALRRLNNCNLITIFKDDEIGRNMVVVNSVLPKYETFGSYLHIDLPASEIYLYQKPKVWALYLFLMLYAEQYVTNSFEGNTLQRGEGIIKIATLAKSTGICETDVKSILRIIKEEWKLVSWERFGNEGIRYSLTQYPSEEKMQGISVSHYVSENKTEVAAAPIVNRSEIKQDRVVNTEKKVDSTSQPSVSLVQRNITPYMEDFFNKRSALINVPFKDVKRKNEIIINLSDKLSDKLSNFRVSCLKEVFGEYLKDQEQTKMFPSAEVLFAYIQKYMKKLVEKQNKEKEQLEIQAKKSQERNKVREEYKKAAEVMYYMRALYNGSPISYMKKEHLSSLYYGLYAKRLIASTGLTQNKIKRIGSSSVLDLPKEWDDLHCGYAEIVQQYVNQHTLEQFKEAFIHQTEDNIHYRDYISFSDYYKQYDNGVAHSKISLERIA